MSDFDEPLIITIFRVQGSPFFQALLGWSIIAVLLPRYGYSNDTVISASLLVTYMVLAVQLIYLIVVARRYARLFAEFEAARAARILAQDTKERS